MFRVISDRRYRRWCAAHALDIAGASFQLETCYYGRRLRTRPGALLVSPGVITHHSYRWSDTLWAIGEPSVRVDIPLSQVASVRRERLSVGWNLMYLGAKEAVVVTMADGKEHFLIVQRCAAELEQAIQAQHNHGTGSARGTSAGG